MDYNLTENTRIAVKFPDSSSKEFNKGVTGYEIASSLSSSLKKNAIACSINDKLSDLSEEISDNCSIIIHTTSDEEIALELIRHDCAHILARAVQEIWSDVKVTIGPVIENGFFYDFDREEPFSENDLAKIEKRMKDIIAKRDPVRTESWEREKAIEYYKEKNEPYKVELIEDIPLNEEIKMYWHGYWQDLCRGPHLMHTGQVPPDAFKLTRVAGAYWRGDSSRPMLQRIYGTAWPDEKKLKSYLLMLEEAEKRDHRRLGRDLDLFHMQEPYCQELSREW